jgi:hypothetical protein
MDIGTAGADAQLLQARLGGLLLAGVCLFQMFRCSDERTAQPFQGLDWLADRRIPHFWSSAGEKAKLQKGPWGALALGLALNTPGCHLPPKVQTERVDANGPKQQDNETTKPFNPRFPSRLNDEIPFQKGMDRGAKVFHAEEPCRHRDLLHLGSAGGSLRPCHNSRSSYWTALSWNSGAESFISLPPS